VKSTFKEKPKRAFPICTLTQEQVKNNKLVFAPYKEMTLEDYYNIEDSVNSLERLRQYQWRDFLGRYKIF